MYTTMEYYSNVFPYIYINMVKVGELSGSLTNSLEQAVEYLDSSEVLTKKIKKIVIPNIAMFCGLFVLLIVGTIVGVPMLQGILDELGASQDNIPALTLWFSNVVNYCVANWQVPTLIVATIVGCVIFYFRTPKGRYQWHYFMYKMPIFGRLFFLLDYSRLMQGVYLNLQNGLRIQDALDVSKNVIKNMVMLSMVETSINNIYLGESWIEPFEVAHLASPMTTEMLRIGMQTDLTEMMGKMLEYVDIDIDQTLQKIVKALPEVTYIVVGIVLVFFVAVILVPCIQMYMGGFLFEAYLG